MLTAVRTWLKSLNVYEAAIGLFAILSFAAFAYQTLRLKSLEVVYANHMADDAEAAAKRSQAEKLESELQAAVTIGVLATAAEEARATLDATTEQNTAIAVEEKKNGTQAASAVVGSTLERMRRRQSGTR